MKKRIIGIFTLVTSVMLLAPAVGFAATTPSLGAADTFSILSGTYTNTAPGTTLSGDLGYTTPPAFTPAVNGTTHQADSVYNQAGIDQAAALSNLDSQPCTFTFAPGAIDLASDTTHGPAGVYVPGVYCIDGAASIGGGGTITLTGTGTYIFRMTGALNTSASSIVASAGGASVCDVFWTPGAATTLGATSTFMGTVIDASGITIGNLATWTGRALAFGGTVTTDANTISSSACATSTGNSGSGSATGGSNASGTSSGGASGSSSAGPNSNTPGLPNTGQGDSNTSLLGVAILMLGLAAGFRVFHKAAYRV